LIEVGDGAVELLFVDGLENLADSRPWLQPEREHMPSEEYRRGWTMLDAERSRAVEKPVHRGAIETAGTPPKAVGLRQPRQQLEIHLLREPPERAVADLAAHLVPGARFQVLGHKSHHLPPHI